MPNEESLSPTLTTESVLITNVTDTKQERDVTTIGVLNTLAQIEVPQGDEIITMKIRGGLAEMLLEIYLGKCKHFVIRGGRNKVLHMLIPCDVLMESASCCDELRKDIEA